MAVTDPGWYFVGKWSRKWAVYDGSHLPAHVHSTYDTEIAAIAALARITHRRGDRK